MRSVVACAFRRVQGYLFFNSATQLQGKAAVYLELYLYTRDHFSMSRTELRAQAAV